ncbi:hypothetical protein ACWELJ_25845 [Nocardia sp. NPDC004582]
MAYELRMDTALDLAAAVPAIWGLTAPAEWTGIVGAGIAPRSLVLALVKPHSDGWNEVERVWVCNDIEYFDRFNAKALTRDTTGTRAVALVIDSEADGHGDSTDEHNQLIDSVAYALQLRGVTLETAYATRELAAWQPLWSLRSDVFIGRLPQSPGVTPGGRYLLAEQVTTREAEALARLA